MREISKSRKDRIVNLLFSGKTYREIAAAENVSIGVISKISKDFKQTAEESSLKEAAKIYNVEETVDRLLELARESREAGVSVQSLLSAVRLHNRMNTLRLKPSQLEGYSEMCDRHKKDFDNFASKAIEFFQLEKKAGVSYEKLPIELSGMIKERDELSDKITELRGEIADLEKERRKAEKSLETELKFKNLSLMEIAYASVLKDTLRRYNFTVEDTSKIPKFLKEIEACGGDVKVFLERAEELKDLKWEVLDLKDEKKILEEVVSNQKDRGLKLQNRADELEITVQQLTENIEKLNQEIERKNDIIRLADCLTSILKSKPTDVDALYSYVCWLKQTISGAAPLERKLFYEESVKRQIVNTLVEFFKEELAPREEVTKLQQELENKDLQISSLSAKIEDLEKTKKEKEDLEKQVKTLNKLIEEQNERFVSDLSIHSIQLKTPKKGP